MSYDFDIIKAYILEAYPNEACGFILEDDSIIPLENIAEDRRKGFKIAAKDFAIYAGQIQYIYHSHCRDRRKPSALDIRTPSKEDLEGQIATDVKWLIFSCDGIYVGTPLELPRTPSDNYLERPFIWYVNDCYTLVQDYYQYEMGITLAPGKIFQINEVRKQTAVFTQFIEEYGFSEIHPSEELQNGDLFIIDNSGYSENHLLIYHNGKLLHQDLLSREEPYENYTDRFRKRLRYVG
jgi:proteasome lid subunit RPN8/RPN11